MLSRIIPAWAGNTLPRVVDSSTPWDHPRVGGEHRLVVRRRRLKRGSSPRGRGTHFTETPQVTLSGIIPAWAGNTERQTG